MAKKPRPARTPAAPPAAPPRTPTALERAEHGAPPVHLVPAERDVLAEALRRGEDLREEVETAVTSYGRWILGAIFHDDASAALDERTKNPVWSELVRRAGGPTLRVSRHLLYVAVNIAANDKRITDQAWRGLDSARKELLLPLRTADDLREAAHHVSTFNLTQAKTREYVATKLESRGKPRQVRLTSKGLVGRLRKLRESLDGARVLRHVGELGLSLDAAERRRTLAEITRLRDLLQSVSHALAGKATSRS